MFKQRLQTVGARKVKYMFRYSLPVQGYEERVEQLVEYCEKNKIDEVIFFTNGIRSWMGGIETIDEAERYSLGWINLEV